MPRPSLRNRSKISLRRARRGVTDPFGFTWRLAELPEELPHVEIERRMHAGPENLHR
jgi:hypothetical protein